MLRMVCACVCVCACVHLWVIVIVIVLCVVSGTQFMESMGNQKVNDLYEKQLVELEVEKPQANASK